LPSENSKDKIDSTNVCKRQRGVHMSCVCL